MSMFESQNSEHQKMEAKRFHLAETKWMNENEIKKSKKHYIQKRYLQYLGETYIENKKKKIVDKEHEFLFGKALDILIRHILTTGELIKENAETKADYYDSSMDRIMRLSLPTYDKDRGNLFNHLTTTIINEIKQQFKNKIISKNAFKNQLKQEGIKGHIINIDKRDVLGLEQDYEILYDTKNDEDNKPLFIVELTEKYKTKKLRIIEDDNAPKFKRKFQEFDYYIPNIIEVDGKKVEHGGVIVEYIDLLYKNEDTGISKNYYFNRMKFLRDRGYQYYIVYSDTYNDENVEDTIIWNMLDKIITSIKADDLSLPYPIMTQSSMQYFDGSLQYIPMNMYNMMKFKDSNWYRLNHDRCKRIIQIEQDIEGYKSMKNEDIRNTRIYGIPYMYF